MLLYSQLIPKWFADQYIARDVTRITLQDMRGVRWAASFGFDKGKKSACRANIKEYWQDNNLLTNNALHPTLVNPLEPCFVVCRFPKDELSCI